MKTTNVIFVGGSRNPLTITTHVPQPRPSPRHSPSGSRRD